MKFIKEYRYLILALIFALLNLALIFFIFGFREYSDTREYINIINFFQGEGTGEIPWRIIRPLGPLLAFPFEFLGEGAGLVIQNIFFYFLSSILIFKITELVYQNKRQAFLASLFFVTATPVLEYGLSYLTDAGGWFFFLLSIFLTLLYLKNKNKKLIPFNGFLSGLGFLLKESGGLGSWFFGFLILLSRSFKFKEKALKIVLFGVFFFIPVVIAQFLIFRYFHYSSLNLASSSFGFTEPGESYFLASLRYLGQLFRAFGILWPFIFIGFWQELRERNGDRMKIFLALLSPSLTFLLWSPGAGVRTVFLSAPLCILLAVKGFTSVANKLNITLRILMIIFLFLVILLGNYWFVSVNREIQFFDLLFH